METAKVDIRKLQLLNDRINQCIDALTQVRLSVHGLSGLGQQGFSGLQGQQAFSGFPAQPGFFGSPLPYPGIQGQAIGFGGVPPYAVPPFVPQVAQQGFGAGLSHTGSLGGAFGIPLPVQPSSVPWANAPGQVQGQFPWISPMLGLSHTNPEEYTRASLSDPILGSRIGLTFPYVHYLFPPSVSMY